MNRGTFLALLFALIPNLAWSAAAPCTLESFPEVIVLKEHELHQVWTLDDSDLLKSEQLPESPAYARFRLDVLERVPDISPDHLFKRQYQDFLNSTDPKYQKEAENPRLALFKEAGRIRPINCLEASLLSVQATRQSMIDQPSEFGAYILEKAENGRSKLKIYYSTSDMMGLRGVNALVASRIESDLAKGWILSAHLHNHPFDFKNSVDILGAPSPGLSDVKFYRAQRESWGLQSARVTNGFDTIEISQVDFLKFKAAE